MSPKHTKTMQVLCAVCTQSVTHRHSARRLVPPRPFGYTLFKLRISSFSNFLYNQKQLDNVTFHRRLVLTCGHCRSLGSLKVMVWVFMKSYSVVSSPHATSEVQQENNDGQPCSKGGFSSLPYVLNPACRRRLGPYGSRLLCCQYMALWCWTKLPFPH